MMTTYAQLLARRSEGVLDEHARAFISNIVDGSRRMNMLVTDLLPFLAQLVLRPTDMMQVLAAALANLRASIDETQATITQESLPLLTVDAARLVQVFQNLVGNAIKYRKPDEVPRIHVSAPATTTNAGLSPSRITGLASIRLTLIRSLACSGACTVRKSQALVSASRFARRSSNCTAARSGRPQLQVLGQSSRYAS
jgi:light-regulated signal transduction histidine kinase (bacteriophytochrome)